MTLENLEEDAPQKAQAYQPHGQRLKGHIIAVTGGDSGIGQATAIACAMEGADVAVSYHKDDEGAEETRRQVENAGGRGTSHQLDQSDPEEVERFFEHVKKELGVPTILVNNAGVNERGKPVEDMENDEWGKDIQVNLNGAFYCTRKWLRMFLDEKGRVKSQEPMEEPRRWTRGVIVNITSIHEEVPHLGASSYDSSKGGLRNLTRTLALELAPERIRAVNVAPGMILTPFNEPAVRDPEERRKQASWIPMKRAALPSEVANAVVFMASDDASYITGTTLFVDGGLMINQGQGA